MVFLCLVFLVFQNIFGAEYPYHPSSPMSLASGFNPFKPKEAYLECIDYDGIKALDTSTNRELMVTINSVKTKRDFFNHIDMSASVSGSYGIFSGGGSVNKLDEVRFNSDDFNWIIVLKSDMGKYGLSNPRLKPSIGSLPSDQLLIRCGTEIITQERRGVVFYALISVHNLTQSERHEMESVIGGGMSGGFWDLQTSLKYKSLLQFSYAVGTVSILVQAQGGEGLARLADIVGGGSNSFANYERLPELVNAYVKGFGAGNAVPVQYFSTTLKAFKSGLPAGAGEFQAAQVGYIYEKYLETLRIIERIDSILSPNSESDIIVSSEDRQNLSRYREFYQGNLNLLFSSGKACFNEVKLECIVPTINDLGISWPKPDVNKKCAKKRDDAAAKGYYPQSFYEMARLRNLVPILGMNGGGIGVVGYNKCELEF